MAGLSALGAAVRGWVKNTNIESRIPFGRNITEELQDITKTLDRNFSDKLYNTRQAKAARDNIFSSTGISNDALDVAVRTEELLAARERQLAANNIRQQVSQQESQRRAKTLTEGRNLQNRLFNERQKSNREIARNNILSSTGISNDALEEAVRAEEVVSLNNSMRTQSNLEVQNIREQVARRNRVREVSERSKADYENEVAESEAVAERVRQATFNNRVIAARENYIKNTRLIEEQPVLTEEELAQRTEKELGEVRTAIEEDKLKTIPDAEKRIAEIPETPYVEPPPKPVSDVTPASGQPVTAPPAERATGQGAPLFGENGSLNMAIAREKAGSVDGWGMKEAQDHMLKRINEESVRRRKEINATQGITAEKRNEMWADYEKGVEERLGQSPDLADWIFGNNVPQKGVGLAVIGGTMGVAFGGHKSNADLYSSPF